MTELVDIYADFPVGTADAAVAAAAERLGEPSRHLVGRRGGRHHGGRCR